MNVLLVDDFQKNLLSSRFSEGIYPSSHGLVASCSFRQGLGQASVVKHNETNQMAVERCT
jgi:hypothetical protein